MFVFENQRFQLHISRREFYIKVRNEGKNSFDDSKFIWEKIIRECDRCKCRRVFIKSNLETFKIDHALKFNNLIDALALPQSCKVAWVENNPANREMVKFIEMSGNNKGFSTITHFYSERLAKKWLKLTSFKQISE